MDIINIIIKILGLTIIAIGVVMVFDARRIIKKWFSFEYKNSSTKTLKLLGTVIAVIGGLIIMINF